MPVCKQGGDRLLIYTPGGGGYGAPDDGSSDKDGGGGDVAHPDGAAVARRMPERSQTPHRRASGRVHSYQDSQLSA